MIFSKSARLAQVFATGTCFAGIVAAVLGLTSRVLGDTTGAKVSRPDYWPTQDWRESAPEEQGIDSTKLLAVFEAVRSKHIPIHSLLVIRNGTVVLDACFFPYEGAVPHDLASCTKSITTTLAGIALQLGKIRSVDERVLSYFPDRRIANRDERKEKLAIKDLLTMRSGLYCGRDGGEPWEMRQSRNWVQFMLDQRMVTDPGTRFRYCSGGMHLLSGVLSAATGTNALAFAKQELFGPLGIHTCLWPEDAQQVSHGWGDLHLFPRDMAKIGFLYLHGGVWNGRRLLPADFVQEALKPLVHTGGDSEYGYGWWVFTGARAGQFEAVGRGGQRISVLPRLKVVVVCTGDSNFDPSPVGSVLSKAIVSDRELPANPAALARLKAAIAAARQTSSAAASAPAEPPLIAEQISGRTYQVADNPLGLKTIALKLPPGPGASLRVTFADGRDETHPIGLDGVPKVSDKGQYGLPVALHGKWSSALVFELDYDTVANINHFSLRLIFDENQLTIEASERSLNQKFRWTAQPVYGNGDR